MKITIRKPAPHFESVIDKYWHFAANSSNSKILMVPMMNHKIVFDYSELVSLDWTSKEKIAIREKNIVLGLQTRPLSTFSDGRYESIGIILKPNGLYQLFGVDTSKYINRAKRLLQLFGYEFEIVRNQIRLEQNPMKKLALLDDFISIASKHYEVEKNVCSFYEELDNFSVENRQIGKFINKIEKSHSTFIKSFRKVYGVTPKQLMTMKQIDMSIQTISKYPEQPLVEIAMDSGFYDQAHFIKTFKKITGILPGEYRKKVREKKVLLESPHFVSMN
jgi:hypothetical protein